MYNQRSFIKWIRKKHKQHVANDILIRRVIFDKEVQELMKLPIHPTPPSRDFDES